MPTNTTVQSLVRDIADGVLDPADALSFVADDKFGGINLFVGRVRRQSHGRAVTGILYDLYDPLALKIFATAAAEVFEEFGPSLKLYAAHAKGQLKVGDIAVVVAAGSPHRDESFRACRALIEKIKHQAPVWKREYFEDGTSQWSEGCALCGSHQDEGQTEPSTESFNTSAANPVIGVVLAGGQSSRMGTDKALLRVNDGTLLDLMLGKLKRTGIAQAVVSGTHAGYVCVPDAQPGRGPLAALASLVQAMPGQRLLITPVDMPHLPDRWLTQLLSTEATQTCVHFQGQPVPMRLDATPLVQATLQRLLMETSPDHSTASLKHFCETLGAIAIAAQETTSIDPWLNCNTPEQWQEYLR